jgi:hypothetical protein
MKAVALLTPLLVLVLLPLLHVLENWTRHETRPAATRTPRRHEGPPHARADTTS